MIREIGKVASVDDDGIDIKIPTSERCESCLGKSVCNFSGPLSAYRTLTLPYQKDLEVGDTVTLEIKSSTQNLSAFIIFGSPIIFFLISYTLLKMFFEFPNSEYWSVASTMVLYIITLIFSNRFVSRSAKFQPKIVEVQRSHVVKKD